MAKLSPPPFSGFFYADTQKIPKQNGASLFVDGCKGLQANFELTSVTFRNRAQHFAFKQLSWAQYSCALADFSFHVGTFACFEFLTAGLITAANSFQYVPVRVDAAYRGLGVFPRLFETMRLGMCERYPIGVTFINRLNPHSFHAHTKKLGMTVIDEFEFNGRPYYGLAFDMTRSVLG